MTKLLKKEENFRFCLLGCGRGTGTVGAEQGPWGQNEFGVGGAGRVRQQVRSRPPHPRCLSRPPALARADSLTLAANV